MSELRFQTVPACAAERFIQLGSGLLDRMAADPATPPTLVVAELAGPALLLGRHQRATSALDRAKVEAAGLPVHRRIGGGRTLHLPEGSLGVYLALPRIGSLLAAPVGPDKFLNRYVRGLTGGLTLAGAAKGVHWFGRDFLSADSRQLGRISQDGLPEGPVLLEAFVSVHEPIDSGRAFSAYPEHEDPRADGPAPVALSEWLGEAADPQAIAGKIAEGYARVYGASVARWDEALPEGAAIVPAVDEAEEGFDDSGVADVPIGFAEALVKHDGAVIEQVRLRGDFIAPAFVLRDLEDQLVGCPLEFTAIGQKVDDAFQRPGAMVLGLRSLRVLADAVLAAAGRLG